MQNIPSVRSIQLFPMLSHSVDSVLPARLAMIRKSDHYAMAVQHITQEAPPELSKEASENWVVSQCYAHAHEHSR